MHRSVSTHMCTRHIIHRAVCGSTTRAQLAGTASMRTMRHAVAALYMCAHAHGNCTCMHAHEQLPGVPGSVVLLAMDLSCFASQAASPRFFRSSDPQLCLRSSLSLALATYHSPRTIESHPNHHACICYRLISSICRDGIMIPWPY